MTTESVRILLKDFPKLSIIRKDGIFTLCIRGEAVAVYEDYTVKGYSAEGDHGVEFIPKQIEERRLQIPEDTEEQEAIDGAV